MRPDIPTWQLLDINKKKTLISPRKMIDYNYLFFNCMFVHLESNTNDYFLISKPLTGFRGREPEN